MKIDGYARISVDLQEDSHENTSIENQKRIIRDFVTKEFPDAELTIYEAHIGMAEERPGVGTYA